MLRQSYAFPDEQTARADFGLVDGVEWVTLSSWVVAHGTLYHATGETTTDADGDDVPVMEAMGGFHVDAVDAAGDGAKLPEAHRVYPGTPSAGIM